MDLIILILGDPWTPDPPPGTTPRAGRGAGLARLVVVTVLTGLLLFGGEEIPATRWARRYGRRMPGDGRAADPG